MSNVTPSIPSIPSKASTWSAPDTFWSPSLTADAPQDCLIVSINGTRVAGRLLRFDRKTRTVDVSAASSRATLNLTFDKFQSISLTAPIPRLAEAPRRVAPFEVALRNGTLLRGETAGHAETPEGLFLLPTSETHDASPPTVHRLFLPKTSYESFDIDPQPGTAFDNEGGETSDVMRLVETTDEEAAGEPESALSLHVARTPAELRAALARQTDMGMMRIGEALVSLGFVTEQQIESALQSQRGNSTLPLGQIMIRMGVITREELRVALAHKMGYPIVNIDSFPVELGAIDQVTLATATRLEVMPVIQTENALVVALDDPAGRRKALEELEFSLKTKVVAVLSQCESFPMAQWTAYNRLGKATEAKPRTSIDGVAMRVTANTAKLVEMIERDVVANDEGASNDEGSTVQESDNPLVRLVNSIIIDAHESGASDVHIENEPGKNKTRVRMRRDGEMHTHLELPASCRAVLVSRLKIMAELDTAEKRKPQDGKINFARYSPAHKIELRVATIPTYGGIEDVVLRLLASAKPLPIGKVGLSKANLAALTDAVTRPYGLVLCVGPTGSGKTTTLHSMLSYINTPKRKIWTAEDPIEITQPGLRQVQVNSRVDWTFAKALRAFLRADPDVIMVGEIRDGETARMAVEASLTGHLVMSTLHTNSAPETVSRLLDMGLDPFNFADSLLAVVAQRLVKRLCPDCRVRRPATEQQSAELLRDYLHAFNQADRPSDEAVLARWASDHGVEGRLQIYAPRGCKTCDQTGYRGREALHEVMMMNVELRRCVQTAATPEVLQATAVNAGMRTLRQDGIEKVLSGTATIEDVRAITNN